VKSAQPSRIWTAALAVFILVPSLLTFAGSFRQDPANEDRPPAPRPELSANPFSASTWRGYDAWFADRLPWRSDVIALRDDITNTIDDRASVEAERNPDVLRGADGWLFFRSNTTPECRDEETIGGWKHEFERGVALIESTGREFWLAVAPSRATVVPGKLGLIDGTCQQRNRVLLADLLEHPNVIDLYETVNQEQHVYREDTHWSPLGALTAAKQIVDAIAPGRWVDAEIFEEAASRVGDLTLAIGRPTPAPVTNVEIVSPAVGSIEQVDSDAEARRSITARTPGQEGRVFIFHDSFGGSGIIEGEPNPDGWARGAARYLRPWFGKVVNFRVHINRLDLLSRAPAQDGLIDSKTVIGLFAEHELYRRLGPGQLRTGLAAAFADELATTSIPTDFSNGLETVVAPADAILLFERNVYDEIQVLEGALGMQEFGDDVIAVHVLNDSRILVNSGAIPRLVVEH